MGWRPTRTRIAWQMRGGRLVAKAGDNEGGLSAEQQDVIRRGVTDRALADGLIDQSEREAFERYGRADLWGLIDALDQREAERRASGDGSVAAASGRRVGDEALLAKAEAEGRFAPSRRAFWRRRLAADRERTSVLLTARPDQGGLTPVPTAAKPPPLVDQERMDHERGFAAAFPGPARTLGYALDRRPGRITDRS